MKTGTILLAQHSSSPGERMIAERCAEYLRSKGRKDVRIAFHSGSPGSEEVMLAMNEEGIDTFAIVPLSISEGRKTVWLMPNAMGLPDNCGSWRMIGKKDVATRFATALGQDPRMASALVRREGSPEDGTGILLLSRGSTHSQCRKTAEYYADALRGAGWKVECGCCLHGRPIGEAVESLKDAGAVRIRVVPMFIAFDGRSAEESKSLLSESEMEIDYSEPLSEIPIYLEIVDNKVPDGW